VGNGRADLAVGGELTAENNWIKAGFRPHDFERVGPPLSESVRYIAFSRKAPLAEVEAWQRAWTAIQNDGTWAAILRKFHLSALTPE